MIAVRKPIDWIGHMLLTAVLLALAAGAVIELTTYYAIPLSQGQVQKSFLAAGGLVAAGLGIALLILWLPGYSAHCGVCALFSAPQPGSWCWELPQRPSICFCFPSGVTYIPVLISAVWPIF
jgi:hypothetical protein